jgi:hypothetical protein
MTSVNDENFDDVPMRPKLRIVTRAVYAHFLRVLTVSWIILNIEAAYSFWDSLIRNLILALMSGWI